MIMTEENPLPVPLCPPKMSNGLDTDGTLVSPMTAGEQPSLRPFSPASYSGANNRHPKIYLHLLCGILTGKWVV